MMVGPGVEQALCEYLQEPTLVLTIGNPMRGDDGAGPAVCFQVARFDAVDCGDAPERYLGLAEASWVSRVLLVDAMDFGAAPGEAAFGRAADLRERAGTTHSTGLATLMRFIEESYGKTTAVLGIQPADTRFGVPMCAQVREAAARIGQLIRQALMATTRSGARGPLHGDGLTSDPLFQREAAWTRS